MVNDFLEANLEGRLGVVVGGSLTKGVEVKLDGDASVEDVAVGRYVTIQGERRRFFGMITDVTLGAIDPRITLNPPDISDPLIAQVLSGTSIYGTLHILPTLTIGLEGLQPVKTVPTHFSVVTEASNRDMEIVFGKEDERHFYVGNPLDMEAKVCLNLEEFVKRSNGVFGKSGTGKTFLTRLLLIGMVQKRSAVSLIFDMHSEYGWEGGSEGGYKVKGLKQLFPSKVAVFALDEESAKRRQVSTDFVVQIGYDDIEPADVEMLAQTLNLTEAATQAPYKLARHFGPKKWLEAFLPMESREGIGELADNLGEHEATLGALQRRLERLKRLRFLVPHAPTDPVGRLLEYLDRGVNVLLEFGRYGDDITAYVLVANLLSRRLHRKYVERTEQALGEGKPQPHPLVIVIEEAHKFLNPAVANQTIFGAIAREMRKYNVTLLVIDQRPSGIDEEVMSQIGTKITCLLENEKDIGAVLAGVSGSSELRSVLAKLESKQQALIFGHAVPMPVVVRTREYGSAESYKELTSREAVEPSSRAQVEGLKKGADPDSDDLWGE